MIQEKTIFGKMRQDAGFTLVEVLIALMMSGIIMIAVYTSSKTQQDTYITQDQVVAMQQNLRAAILLMAKEIRMAGYDPTEKANATITTATATHFGFTKDTTGGEGDGIDNDGDGFIDGADPEGNEVNFGDGDTSDSNEAITFGFSTANDADDNGVADSGFAPLGRNTGGGYQPIAANIHAIEFFYTLSDGSQSLAPANPADIVAVQVTVLAQTAIVDPKFNAALSFTTPAGTGWNLPSGYRGRMETMTIKCRNMGL